MRWAKLRGLPVRRMPGGKTATVYALRSELDQWASSHENVLIAVEAGPTTKAAGLKRPQLILAVVTVVGVLALAGVVGVGLSKRSPAPVSPLAGEMQMPADPELSALYVQARDDWAQRTPEGLNRAIAGLEIVTRRDPHFAPALSALADAYLLASEFGTVPDEIAFPKAKTAALASLAINADLAAGHRALGFIAYWWDSDPKAAGRSFRRAIALAPNSAQTHFWYGNILSDNGHHREALEELRNARLLEPGSVPIQTDLAWAQWRAGDQAAAVTALTAIKTEHPEYSAAYDCIADARLAVGDYAGYVAAYAEYARLRQDDRLIGIARAQQAALTEGGVQRLQALMMREVLLRTKRDIGRNHSRAAFIASVAGDRTALLSVMTAADKGNEKWGASGLTRRIRDRWAEDDAVIRLLDRRAPEPAI